MSGKGLLMIGLAAIAAVFVALVIRTRSDRGARLGRETHAVPVERADCAHAVDAAGARVEDMFGAGARARLRDDATRLCRDDAWPSDVIDCLRAADDASALSSCVGRLPPEAHAHLMAALEHIPRIADDPPLPPILPSLPPPPPRVFDDDNIYGDLLVDAAPAPSGLPAECIEYGRLVDAIAGCDKLPAQSRDALRQAYAQMKATWDGMAAPDAARAAMATGCREAAAAMQQAMSSLCP